MKKYRTTQEYKIKNTRKSEAALQKLAEKNAAAERKKKEKQKEQKEENEKQEKKQRHGKGKGKNEFRSKSSGRKDTSILDSIIQAPVDFRLIENTEKCLEFFRKIRNEDNVNTINHRKFIIMSLSNVELIDYGTISVLTAISDDLEDKKIIMRGNFPINKDARKFIEDSGFLDHMVTEKNKPFPKAEKSDLIFFEKGKGVLSVEDNRRITSMIKNVINFLTGEQKKCLPVKTILLEICGNSIEWADTSNKQWVFGVKYETDKVIFTVTDVGKGILQTLHKKFGLKIVDFITKTSDHKILLGAFNQKYGSNTQEVNRNKGLPSVKANFESGVINNLKVLTNNVILHFDNESLTRTLKKGTARFKGTIYQWEMTKECLSKIE